MSYKLCVHLGGDLTPEHSLLGHFQEPGSLKSAVLPLLSSEQQKRVLTRTDQPEKLTRMATLSRDYTPLALGKTGDMHVLVDSIGGADDVMDGIMELSGTIRRQSGKVFYYCTNDVQSTAANCVGLSSRDEIHCLPETAFMWHLPQHNDDFKNLEHVAEHYQIPVAAVLRAHASRQRNQLYQLLCFFGSRAPTELWPDVEDRIVETFYTDAEKADEDLTDLVRVSNLSREERRNPAFAKEFDDRSEHYYPFYKQNGDLEYTGAQLQELTIVRTHPTIADLAQQFARSSQLSVTTGGMKTIWDRFFTLSTVIAEARKQGIPGARFDYDADGGGAIMVPKDSENDALLQTLMEKYIK